MAHMPLVSTVQQHSALVEGEMRMVMSSRAKGILTGEDKVRLVSAREGVLALCRGGTRSAELVTEILRKRQLTGRKSAGTQAWRAPIKQEAMARWLAWL